MSNGPTKLKAASLKSNLTPAQRTWIKQLGDLEAPVTGDDAGDPANAVAPVSGRPGAGQGLAKESLTGDRRDLVEGFVPGLGEIPGIIKGILTDLFCNCKIHNRTDKTLELDPNSFKIESGKFKSPPPNEIEPNDPDATFVTTNKFPNTAGTAGELEYIVDEQKTRWRIKWNNPRIGDNTAETDINGPNKDAVARYEKPKAIPGQGENANFTYTLKLKGGGPLPQPQPQPGPQPGPTPQEVPASCLITVTNNTKFVLTLSDQGHDRGDFMTFPPQTVQPGASASFASVETPNSKDEGCKGFLVWEVGSPVAAVWRMEWDNPEQARNTTKTTLEPQTAGFRSLDQIGQGEDNVPVAFTISGGGEGPAPKPGPAPIPTPGPSPEPAPGPTPEPSPEPEPVFIKPPGSRQPTLRLNDKSPDGWVEFLQQQLNIHMGLSLKIDGKFGQATLTAVRGFQKKQGIQVDGTVGNQTWAALRGAPAEAPSTDGRKPGTFVEKGAEARWDHEKKNATYEIAGDKMFLFATSVGDAPIEGFNAIIRVTPPNTKPKSITVKIPKPDQVLPTGAGHPHTITVSDFKKKFPTLDSKGKPIPNPKFAEYLIEARFEDELGTDLFSGNLIV